MDSGPAQPVRRSSRLAWKFWTAAFALLIVALAAATAFPADERTSTIVIGNSRIDVNVESGAMKASKEDKMKWVRCAARPVTAYHGSFPVPHRLLRIVPSDGKGFFFCRTLGPPNGGFFSIHVGKQT